MKLVKIFSFLLFVILITGGFLAWQIFGPAVKNPGKQFLYIPSQSNYTQVKDSLIKNDFIRGDFWLDKIANYAGLPTHIRPGKYKITNGMSIYSMVKMLRGGRQLPVNLVITKIRTKEDLARRISRYFEADSLTVIQFLSNNDSLRSFDVDSNTVLTAVIPNTYTYYWNTSPRDIFQKLYNEDKKFWNGERSARANRLGLTKKEVYIIASIVEEETNQAEDKGKIASVYINRLEKGMPLGADPTVKFAMRDFSLKRIYHKHLQYESPYNTYRNKGLPPGPICTPSIKTLDAVLDAPQTDYLYFVARADFSGHSDFSNNYQQHLIYARAYQQALNKLIKEREEKKANQ